MWSQCERSRRAMGVKPNFCWIFIVLYIFKLSDAQLPPVQQIHFVPKNYFLPSSQSESDPSSSSLVSSPQADITRNPRHLAPDRYYVGPAQLDQTATATTSLRSSTLDRSGNPINFNSDLVDQELKLDISNNNPHNNQFEAKILRNSQQPNLRKSARGKLRRVKARPPKNVIIYSLPEQSFFANHGREEENASYSTEDSRESNVGLRSDIGEELVDDQEQQQLQQQVVAADSKEFRTNSVDAISQKKALLGQCMAQCIDAIL